MSELLKILLVDDQSLTRKPVEVFLRRHGSEPVSCTDGNKALEAVRRERPRCILMDIAMPHLDGLEATRRLKSDPDTAHIPIIVVSSLPQPEEALDAGACDFLLKGSYTLKELVDTIAKHTAS